MAVRRIIAFLLGLVLGGSVMVAQARPPQERVALLRQGVNITGWFRYPVSLDPAALSAYMPDAAMRELRAVGFTFVRLAVDPALLDRPVMVAALAQAVRRLRGAGLAVVISLHPIGWTLEERSADRAALADAWRRLVQVLRHAGADGVFPELLNEPVFPLAAPAWTALRRQLAAQLRAALPDHTLILPGNEWSSIAGLLATGPDPDPNVVYTFHFYDPGELTALAPWRNDLDRRRLAALPFPAAGCATIAAGADQPTADAIRFYCAMSWNQSAVASRIAAAGDWARRNDAVLLLGEFGATSALNAPARANWLQTVRSAAETNGIGWALWGYDDIMGFALPRPIPVAPVLDPAVLHALGLGIRH